MDSKLEISGSFFNWAKISPQGEMDLNQIQQVIFNLINNAADAIEDSGVGNRVVVQNPCHRRLAHAGR